MHKDWMLSIPKYEMVLDPSSTKPWIGPGPTLDPSFGKSIDHNELDSDAFGYPTPWDLSLILAHLGPWPAELMSSGSVCGCVCGSPMSGASIRLRVRAGMGI